jgi:hypothetical protein
MRRYTLVVGFVFGVVAPQAAFAQADNSNSITEPERSHAVVTASFSEASRALPRWLRDDARRRERPHALGDGLTSAELGLLYGTEFATGATADWPATPSP